MVHKYRRIIIIGCSGSGKSTLAKQISQTTHTPVVSLDKEFWKPGWEMTPRDVWRERVQELVAEDQWIMDGSFASTLDIRLPRAQLIIYFHLPRTLCLYRAMKRVVTTYGRTREEMADGCPERFDWGFVKYIWAFHKNEDPVIQTAINNYGSKVKLINISTQQDAKQLFHHMRNG